MLRQANIISHFDKEPSFDRIFPNQDYHSGKGLGNLIALPLQVTSLQNGNSCFLDPDTMQPYEDQWEFLHSVQKTSEESLKLLYKTLFTENPQEILTSSFSPNSTFALEIRISNQIYLKRIHLNRKLIVFLRDQLNFYNSEMNIIETDLYAPFDYKVDQYETISRILVHDTQRNSLILKDIEENANRFKTILILTERKAHVDILNLYLKDKYETITIHGEDSETSRKSKIDQIKQGHFKIVISTGQYFGEGIDISNLECLFIVYPFAFEGKLIQYIGRIQRSEKQPVIFDYRDSKIEYFEKMFKQRKRYYNKLLK